MFRILKLMNIRNRAYVVDNKGNKLFYGTEYRCKEFIKYMESDNNGSDTCPTGQREDCLSLVKE